MCGKLFDTVITIKSDQAAFNCKRTAIVNLKTIIFNSF